jgi:2-phosphosulfolactate phosphatase
MQIHIRHYAAGARAARGLTVVIDVFRAFTVACHVFARGAESMTAVGDVAAARRLKKKSPKSVLVGERHARKPEGFDYGNSPSEIREAALSCRRVIHTTHAGTQALTAASNADEVITGSFVNASAIVAYVQKQAPSRMSLVCAGFEGGRPALEDILCAGYLRDRLNGEAPEFNALRRRLRNSEAARRFFDPAEPGSPATDFDLCLELDRFDFVIRRHTFGPGWCELKPAFS